VGKPKEVNGLTKGKNPKGKGLLRRFLWITFWGWGKNLFRIKEGDNLKKPQNSLKGSPINKAWVKRKGPGNFPPILKIKVWNQGVPEPFS